MKWISDPESLPVVTPDRRKELAHLQRRILAIPSMEMDEKIHRLNTQVSQQIDCTRCGNCCKQLNPPVLEEEIPPLAEARGITPSEFCAQHLHRNSGSAYYFFKKAPCIFLHERKCTVYEKRPVSCADYPHLHQQEQKFRFARTLEQYSICPIVYNVVEMLEQELKSENLL